MQEYPHPFTISEVTTSTDPGRPEYGSMRIIASKHSGVLLAFDIQSLVAFAQKADSRIELVPQVGDLIAGGDPLFRLYQGDAVVAGFGMAPTLGIGSGWMALDMNVAWSDVNALDKPVFTFVFGPRVGKTFNFKKAERNIAFWAGGFRVKFSSETNGSVNLNEVLPVEELQPNVDAGIDRVEQEQVNVDTWWEGLTQLQQNNPVNIAKYETANRTISTVSGLLTSMDGAFNDDEYAAVQYSLDKSLKDMWNFIIGTQFQWNKHIMIRGEYGFLGSRQQIMVGLQYRFGL